MKEKIYAINICLIPSEKMYSICQKLNSLDTESWYNKNSRNFIPHATLAMKYVSEEKLEKIKKAFRNIDIFSIETKTLEYYVKNITPSDCWTWIFIEKTPELKKLQEEICKITKTVKNNVRDRNSYAIDDFFEENQIPEWDEDFFLAKEHLHITLWKNDIQDYIHNKDLPKETIFDTLAIWYMWNYGSVREILYKIPLK